MDTLLEKGATAGKYVATLGVFVFGVGVGSYIACTSACYIVRGVTNVAVRWTTPTNRISDIE